MYIRLARAAAVFLAVLLCATLGACTPADGGDVTTPPTEAPTEAPTESPDDDPSDGVSAVDFRVLDWEGNTVKLSDFYGKPIVVNFWASWCPPCKAELPDFEAACKAYEGEVTFLMVNLTDGDRETVEIAKSYISAQGYTFPVYFDTTYEAAYVYGISSIPQTYFINAEGEIVARATGMINAAQLEQGIGMIHTAP